VGHDSCMHSSGWKRIGDHHAQADHVITSTHQGGAENKRAQELKCFGRIPTGAFQQVQIVGAGDNAADDRVSVSLGLSAAPGECSSEAVRAALFKVPN
jgi:hypothetical protein